MEFITKELYYSMKLYENFGAGRGDVENYNETINLCIKNHPEYINKIKNSYILYLNQGNYKMKQVKEILLDEHDNLRKIDEASYHKLMETSDECNEYMIDQRMLWIKESAILSKGHYPKFIKHLAKYRNFLQNFLGIHYKDDILSIRMNEYSTEISALQAVIWSFKVKQFSSTLPLGMDLKKCQIVHVELVHVPENSLFEYSLLVRNYSKKAPDDYIEEIKILFSDIVDMRLEPYQFEKTQNMLRLVEDRAPNITGEKFNQLIDYCIDMSTHFSFTKHWHHKPNEMYYRFLKELQPFYAKTIITNHWFCYSAGLISPFEIYLFTANKESREVIKRYIDNLFLVRENKVINQTDLPEDLCFFTEDKLLLGTVSHEYICYAYPFTKEAASEFMKLGSWVKDYYSEEEQLDFGVFLKDNVLDKSSE